MSFQEKNYIMFQTWRYYRILRYPFKKGRAHVWFAFERTTQYLLFTNNFFAIILSYFDLCLINKRTWLSKKSNTS